MTAQTINSRFSARKGRDSTAGSQVKAIRLVTRVGALAMSLATLAGCGALSIGQGDFSCPGMPDGVQCMSTRDVYAATDDGQVPVSMRGGEENYLAASSGSGSLTEPAGAIADPVRDPVNAYVAPRLPDKPVPVRTPAQVMRIWVAPWEDTNGDLNVSGYLYTEIEPRRWVLGDPAPSSNPVLSPLTVRPKRKKAPAPKVVEPVSQPQPTAAQAAQTSTENKPSQEN